MTETSTYEILNDLLTMHSKSLAMYLSYAKPWALAAHPKARAVLEHMVEDQARTVDRLAAIILESGPVDNGEFPIFFTGWHDLSVDFLVGKLIERQKRSIAVINNMIGKLAFAPYAQAVAKEVLGEAKGHLENLQEVATDLAATAA
ncbi:hypothetical protein ETAA8_35770 [Anatilimnocola aggregata]|uniref:Uncharacterized protein n=1 Tax=Anatilimnocola aggregata TaxID=2528021 RepID=A0A517YE29_9BACT|nr:hypothetical protein [Anatilimnocola aggregata]QDU28476.1 hypothetical protein ETAA8_35770 [Anatilimnocola aggregata]